MPDRLMIDANILVDFLRGKQEAVDFIRGLETRPLLSPVVVGELYAGVRDGTERERLDRLVAAFRVLPITREVAVRGGLYTRQYGPSHGVGLGDALIAAGAESGDAVVATLNTKHFPMAKKLLRPY